MKISQEGYTKRAYQTQIRQKNTELVKQAINYLKQLQGSHYMLSAIELSEYTGISKHYQFPIIERYGIQGIYLSIFQ
ncbi:MAG: hypothetical protein RR470_12120 [Vagococcus sp.]|uniref:hypothetical protein n=1 Tax=Vagococcus sp. TaxID=1933889 RepID=UPI002FC9FF87